MGSYKWGYKSPNMYSYPTYNPIYNCPSTSKYGTDTKSQHEALHEADDPKQPGRHRQFDDQPLLSRLWPSARTVRVRRRVLGGSWVVISGVISPLSRVITIVTLLITLLISTHEPPSRQDFGFNLR